MISTVSDSREIEDNLGDSFESQEFSMNVNGGTFRLIFSQLYTNKPLAIVRELCANAHDSHTAADKHEIPFNVHLPTLYEPFFSVRDYGTSMSHEMLMHLYTTAFSSSKQDTNDQVGYFGLGSKTPFALTDSFNVTCWLDGMERVYLASMTDNGVPKLSFIHSSESEQPQGFEVTFPVQNQHFGDFTREAEWVIKAYDTPFTGVEHIPFSFELEGDIPDHAGRWKIGHLGSHTTLIRQGPVLYSVTRSQLPYKTTLADGYTLLLDVPVGTFEVAPSREALSFDDKTKALAQELLEASAKAAHGILQAEIDAAPNRLAAAKLSPVLGRLFNEEKRYRGRPIPDRIEIGRTRTIPQIRFKQAKTGRDMGEGEEPTFWVRNLGEYRILVDHGRRVPARRERLHRMLKGERAARRLTFTVYKPTSQQLSRLVRLLGLKPEQIISMTNIPELPETPPFFAAAHPAPVTPPRSRKIGIYRFLNYEQCCKIDTADLSDPTTFYWVPFERKVKHFFISELRLTWRGGDGTYGKDGEDINLLAGIGDRPLYFLTPNAQKRYGKPENEWTTLVIAGIKARTDRILERVTYNAAMNDTHDWVIRLPKPKLASPHHLSMGLACRIIGDVEVEKARMAGARLGIATRAKYPMLFNGHRTKETSKRYVEMVDFIDELDKLGNSCEIVTGGES